MTETWTLVFNIIVDKQLSKTNFKLETRLLDQVIKLRNMVQHHQGRRRKLEFDYRITRNAVCDYIKWLQFLASDGTTGDITEDNYRKQKWNVGTYGLAIYLEDDLFINEFGTDGPDISEIEDFDDIPDIMRDRYVQQYMRRVMGKKTLAISYMDISLLQFCSPFDFSYESKYSKSESYIKILKKFCTNSPKGTGEYIWSTYDKKKTLAKLNVSEKRWNSIIKNHPTFESLCKSVCPNKPDKDHNQHPRVIELKKRLMNLYRELDDPFYFQHLDRVNCNNIFHEGRSVEMINREILLCEKEIENIKRQMTSPETTD